MFKNDHTSFKVFAQVVAPTKMQELYVFLYLLLFEDNKKPLSLFDFLII